MPVLGSFCNLGPMLSPSRVLILSRGVSVNITTLSSPYPLHTMMALAQRIDNACETTFRRCYHLYTRRMRPNLPCQRTCFLSQTPAQTIHQFHTSSSRSSALFNLGGLSTSRESQYLSKERGIPRTEFSPHLELIRSSEVDTQRAPGSNKASHPAPKTIHSSAKEEVKSQTTHDVHITIPLQEYNNLKSRLLKHENGDKKHKSRDTTLGDTVFGATIMAIVLYWYRTVGAISAKEKADLGTAPPKPETTAEADISPDPAVHIPQDARTAQSRTLSRLFWAAED